MRYMAPEVALSLPYSHKAEVFSFATVVWQMCSHDVPFATCDVPGFYKRVCEGGERPKIPQHLPPALVDLLQRCWKPEHAERPEASEIVAVLRELLASLPEERRRPSMWAAR